MKTATTTTYPIGSVSCATMRTEDLIPAFLYELQSRKRQRTLKRQHYRLVREIESRMDTDDYYQSDASDFDLESLVDALSEYAGPYFYFGAHCGDGSDFGYWLSECFTEDFDGLQVSDSSEIPTKYRGEVLIVNDHGNCSLYLKTARTMRVIWEVV